MLFSTAGIECSPLLPVVAAFVITFFTSMGGISGAFLLVPFQISVLGIMNPSVSATTHLFNVIACPGGVWRFFREQRLLLPLSRTILYGSLPGAFIGAIIRVYYLPDPHAFMLFAGVVLLYLGGRFLVTLCRQPRQTQKQPVGKVELVSLDKKLLVFRYGEQVYSLRRMSLSLLCLIVGLAGGIYGVGGGALLSPFLVALFALPVHATAGAVLLATCGTSLFSVLFFFLLGLGTTTTVQPDMLLGLCLGLGGIAGMYCGARCQKFFPGRKIHWGLALLLLFTGLRYLSRAFL